MNNTIKQKYSPCELSVVEFKVERGFATSEGAVNPNQINPNATAMTWIITKDQNQNDFQNQQYNLGSEVTWFN